MTMKLYALYRISDIADDLQSPPESMNRIGQMVGGYHDADPESCVRSVMQRTGTVPCGIHSGRSS